MKFRICVILISLSSIGCEPSYRIYVRNHSPKDLYLRISPSVDSLYPKWMTYHDSLINIKVTQNENYALYIIKPAQVFRIWGYIGNVPKVADIPFNYVRLDDGTDSLILNSKDKIINQLKREGKKYDYFIDILK